MTSPAFLIIGVSLLFKHVSLMTAHELISGSVIVGVKLYMIQRERNLLKKNLSEISQKNVLKYFSLGLVVYISIRDEL